MDIVGDPFSYINLWKEMRTVVSPEFHIRGTLLGGGSWKPTTWIVGVCRESIKRKGTIVSSAKNGYWVINQIIKESLKIPDVTLQKLGIYPDYEGGQVIFCNAKDISHLYTFTDTFTEKLYPIFNPCANTYGDNSEPIYLNPG
ncbi:E3 ubiquitin-protein ligase TRIM69-like [Rhincodon typus]|uniref:E3 ubiquitin-protein ligase TRIM69-like n=1 Tax=Rhincodon typus TaxID=259920 RepID=UPI00202DC45C|nr:E3 ubiquitin-protein ligase TRIM69-like [Rhincodon typus]